MDGGMDKQGCKLCDLKLIQGKFSWAKSQPTHEGDLVAHISVDNITIDVVQAKRKEYKE